MNLIRLAWKNIRHQWSDTILGIVLLAFGLGTISMLILIEKQLVVMSAMYMNTLKIVLLKK